MLLILRTVIFFFLHNTGSLIPHKQANRLSYQKYVCREFGICIIPYIFAPVTTHILQYAEISRRHSQFFNRILYKSYISSDCPVPWFSSNGSSFYRKFKSLVFDLSIVDPHRVVTTGIRQGYLLKQIFCLFNISVRCKRQTLVEQAEVYSYIILFGGFPLQIRIWNTWRNNAGFQASIRFRWTIAVIACQSLIRRDGLIAHLSPTQA